MGGSTAQKRLRNEDSSSSSSFNLNEQPTSYSPRRDLYVPSTAIMPSLCPNDTPIYNNYQPAPTDANTVEAPTGKNDMWLAMDTRQTPSFEALLPFCANTFGSSQGFFSNNIGVVDHQHNLDSNVFSAGFPQTPPEYPQSSGYAFTTYNPQFPASGGTDPLVEIQKIQAHLSQQDIPGFPQTQNSSRSFAIPPVKQTHRQATAGQNLSDGATLAPYLFEPDSLNGCNAFSTFVAAPFQQPSQNSCQKAPQPQQCLRNAPPNGGLLSGFTYFTQKQGLQQNSCIEYQIPHTQLLVAQGTQQPVAISAPVQKDGYRQQQSAKMNCISCKESTSTDFDSIIEEQPTAVCKVVDMIDNGPVLTPTPALEGTDAQTKDDKLFDQYVSRFIETGHPVQRQLYDHEQGKGVDKPAKYSLAEKELAIGQNSKYEWERDLAIEQKETEKTQGLSLPEQKTETQKKREKNAEQRRRLKEKKREKESAQKASAILEYPAVMPTLATENHRQTAPAQTAPTQVAPALTKEALKELGPLTLARAKQLWHPVEHAYMRWEPKQDDYDNLILPSSLGNVMYKCAHEEPKCEVAPITCTHPCCRTGVPWKKKKDLLVKAARKMGDSEAEKRGFPRPKHTRGAREPEAPPTQSSAAPAPAAVSKQLINSPIAVSTQAPGSIPYSSSKPAVVSSGQLEFLKTTNPSLFASLQAQSQPNFQATENRSSKRQREEDEPLAAPRSKRISGWTAQDRTPEPATVVPSQRPANVPGWASQDRQPDSAPAVPSRVPAGKPITQGVAIASAGPVDPPVEEEDGEMNSLFDDDGLGSLFGDDDDLNT